MQSPPSGRLLFTPGLHVDLGEHPVQLSGALGAVVRLLRETSQDDPVELGSQPLTASAPALTTLAPGVLPRIDQDLDVNVVFLGFRTGRGPQEIDDARFRSLLAPLSVSPTTDAQGRDVPALAFHLRHHVVHAPAWYEDAVFGYLKAIGAPQTTPISAGPGTPALPISPTRSCCSRIPCIRRVGPSAGAQST